MTEPVNRLDAADVDRARAVDIVAVARARGLTLRRSGAELVGPCPHCEGRDRFAIKEQLFNCRGCGGKGRGAVSFVQWLDAVGFREAVEILTGRRNAPVSGEFKQAVGMPTASEYDRRQREKARWLWSKRQPISGSIAETYLREARSIACPLPPTLAFLAPHSRGQHPAMIAAFGICDEVEPGIVTAPRDVVAVHLTLLKPDGSGKAGAEKTKIMIGKPSGSPIVIAPPNDLLGLAICEGIEDALSIHQATGLGAWAAGSAPHMGKLADAVPSWIDCVSIFADADADQQGERNAALLAEQLTARGIFAEVLAGAAS
jgi:phage/plasmid primase-like uncharacterized protein